MRKSVIALALLAMFAAPAAAADKTHQQIMAEIRMLQEQQQQLQQMLGNLADTLKTITAKIDDQTAATRKGFADQKVLVDGIAEGVRVLREKSDDTNVRLSTMSQELAAMRQTVAAIPSMTSPVSTDPTGDPTAVPPGATAPTVFPQQAWDSAFNDYIGGQYDLAIAGFELYLKNFPTSARAGEAQLNIGNSYYNMGQYTEAVAAYQKVISDYAQSSAVPTAYYKLGLSYEAIKQPALARQAYETLLKNHPTALGDVQLAKQRLDALNKKQE